MLEHSENFHGVDTPQERGPSAKVFRYGCKTLNMNKSSDFMGRLDNCN